MAVATTVQRYLAEHRVRYDLVNHPRTYTASETAQASHVSGNRIAKGVVLKDDAGYLLAVVPASRHLKMDMVDQKLGHHLELAAENEITTLFFDCEPGAVPAVGSAYGLRTILDESLEEQPEVYFDAGDHTTLVHLDRDEFHRLMENVPRGRFSSHS